MDLSGISTVLRLHECNFCNAHTCCPSPSTVNGSGCYTLPHCVGPDKCPTLTSYWSHTGCAFFKRRRLDTSGPEGYRMSYSYHFSGLDMCLTVRLVYSSPTVWVLDMCLNGHMSHLPCVSLGRVSQITYVSGQPLLSCEARYHKKLYSWPSSSLCVPIGMATCWPEGSRMSYSSLD